MRMHRTPSTSATADMCCYGKGAMFGEMEPSGSPCCCCSRRKSHSGAAIRFPDVSSMTRTAGGTTSMIMVTGVTIRTRANTPVKSPWT
ncbi:hypothetical protein MAR_012451 [Mya arenaria]|uniref:Uncharacterized protein n=1 Tax=Mya arenaria TaxID=6604 RepID=A0ABY7FYL2_MYAAR|nr:hypothetical protein MAR_012451 [Mya arenaria]